MKVRLDGFVLFVEMRQIRNEVFDDICMRERVDARLLLRFRRNAAYIDATKIDQLALTIRWLHC